MKYTSIVTLLCCCVITSVFAQPENRDSIIGNLLNTYAGKDKPGFTLGIIDHGRLVFSQGYGMADLSRGNPNGTGISYMVASVTKQFTAAAIIDLADRNLLGLDDDVRKHIPELPDYGQTITINHLLYHTSGIRDYMVLLWLSGISFEGKFTNTDVLTQICHQRALNFEPGTRCVYSNSNYALLATVLERVSGQTLDSYLKNRVFAPLGIVHAGFDASERENHRSPAISYRSDAQGFTAFANDYGVIGDGGLWTTLGDLAKWDAAFYDTLSLNHRLLERGKLGDGNPLYYGMGIIFGTYRNEPIQMHPGAFLGYRAELLRFPARGVSIICLANREDIDPEVLTRRVADAYLFGDNPQPMQQDFPDYDASAIDAVAGTYEVAHHVLIDISHNGGILTGQLTGQPRQTLHPLDKWRYRIGDGTDQVLFEKDHTGAVTGLSVIQQAGHTKARRLEPTASYLAALAGVYRNAELAATYTLAVRDGELMYRVGQFPWSPLNVLEQYNSASFSYRNLEKATLSFKRGSDGKVIGFTLSSGRISGLDFERSVQAH